jgi:hypothetical protein
VRTGRVPKTHGCFRRDDEPSRPYPRDFESICLTLRQGRVRRNDSIYREPRRFRRFRLRFCSITTRFLARGHAAAMSSADAHRTIRRRPGGLRVSDAGSNAGLAQSALEPLRDTDNSATQETKELEPGTLLISTFAPDRRLSRWRSKIRTVAANNSP